MWCIGPLPLQSPFLSLLPKVPGRRAGTGRRGSPASAARWTRCTTLGSNDYDYNNANKLVYVLFSKDIETHKYNFINGKLLYFRAPPLPLHIFWSLKNYERHLNRSYLT